MLSENDDYSAQALPNKFAELFQLIEYERILTAFLQNSQTSLVHQSSHPTVFHVHSVASLSYYPLSIFSFPTSLKKVLKFRTGSSIVLFLP